MTIAIAIIGANFGDEGKGLATDYFVRSKTQDGRVPLVARCNGGAQAGHTVVDGDRRHVFGHVGSGAFAGAETYLAQNFIINPFALTKELNVLLTRGVRNPVIHAHRACRVTTIYDMAMNSLIELMRDGERHGSCGLGINETVTRHRAGFFLTFEDVVMKSPMDVAAQLKRIREEWVPRRLKELDIYPQKFKPNVVKKMGIYFSMFATDPRDLAVEMATSLSAIRIALSPESTTDPLIVEGAQGIMLDEFMGKFPHVTRSVTGLSSHVQAAYERGYSVVQPIYMTRAYLTRHGNGELHNEGEVITNVPLVDTTNIHNEWQGTLRYAPLDLDALKNFIETDLLRASVTAQLTSSELKKPAIFVTCMDQLGEHVQVCMNNQLEIIPSADLLYTIAKHTGIAVEYTSHGPTAKDVSNVLHVL